MKGISLPINAMIIITIGALVLVVVSGLFISSSGSSTKILGETEAWNLGCSQARVRGCNLADFQSNGLNIKDFGSVQLACTKVFGAIPSDNAVEVWCHDKCCG